MEFDSVPISQYYLLACDDELLPNVKQCSRQELPSEDFPKLFCMLSYSSQSFEEEVTFSCFLFI